MAWVGKYLHHMQKNRRKISQFHLTFDGKRSVFDGKASTVSRLYHAVIAVPHAVGGIASPKRRHALVRDDALAGTEHTKTCSGLVGLQNDLRAAGNGRRTACISGSLIVRPRRNWAQAEN